MRTTTWSNIGETVNTRSYQEALSKAGLDYTVRKEPIVTESGLTVPNRVAAVDSLNRVHGIVSSHYGIVQNESAFEFLDVLCQEAPVSILKAGETPGKITYMIAEHGANNILGDDYAPHMIFQNSHNGACKLGVAFVNLRIICQNQFRGIFEQNQEAFTIRHSRNAEQRLQAAKEVIIYIREYNKLMETFVNVAAAQRITQNTLDTFISCAIPYPKEATDRQKTAVNRMREVYLNAYRADDNTNFRGTAFGAVNAYYDYLTHKQPLRSTASYDYSQLHGFMTGNIANRDALSVLGI